MKDSLALAYVTCDKYSHVWEEWIKAYRTYWGVDIPEYFCGEELVCPFDGFEHLPHKSVPASGWTAKLRSQVEQINAEYIFVWLDDMIPLMDISIPFVRLFNWAYDHKVDAMRIMARRSASTYMQVGHLSNNPIYKLTHKSRYLVSFSPNIYKKEFLLDVLQWDESPWDCELIGSRRIVKWLPEVYAHHIDGWVNNSITQ